MTKRQKLEAALDQLSTALDVDLILDSYSPGDGWTRYSVRANYVEHDGTVTSGQTAPFGDRVWRLGELVDAIYFALRVLDVHADPSSLPERGAGWRPEGENYSPRGDVVRVTR